MIPATFALAALLLGALSLRHGTWRHAAAYLASVSCIALSIWFAFGTPRPAWLGHKPGITLLAMSYQEGSWIAFWTRDANGVPVAYIEPWSELTAAQAQAVMKAAAEAHGTAQWGAPRGGSQGGGQRGGEGTGASGVGGAPNQFRVAPHSPLPPKEGD